MPVSGPDPTKRYVTLVDFARERGITLRAAETTYQRVLDGRRGDSWPTSKRAMPRPDVFDPEPLWDETRPDVQAYLAGNPLDPRLNNAEWLRAAYATRSAYQIGEELGCTWNTVTKHLVAAGIPLREAAERHVNRRTLGGYSLADLEALIAEHGSATKAAKVLGVSQPTVTRRLAALRKEAATGSGETAVSATG